MLSRFFYSEFIQSRFYSEFIDKKKSFFKLFAHFSAKHYIISTKDANNRKESCEIEIKFIQNILILNVSISRWPKFDLQQSSSLCDKLSNSHHYYCINTIRQLFLKFNKLQVQLKSIWWMAILFSLTISVAVMVNYAFYH